MTSAGISKACRVVVPAAARILFSKRGNPERGRSREGRFGCRAVPIFASLFAGLLGAMVAAAPVRALPTHARARAGPRTQTEFGCQFPCDHGNADAFRVHADFFGSSAAYALVAQRSGCTFLFLRWSWAAGIDESASSHAHHADHDDAPFCLPELEPAGANPSQASQPPPPESETQGALSSVSVEIIQQPGGLEVHFPPDSSRLQVDGHGLGAGGESRASFILDVEGQTGQMTLLIKDAVVTLSKEGLFQNASVVVEPHPQVSGVYLVRLGPHMDFVLPGLNSEAHVSLEGDAGETGGVTPARRSSWGGLKLLYR